MRSVTANRFVCAVLLLAGACGGVVGKQESVEVKTVTSAYERLADYSRKTDEPLTIQVHNVTVEDWAKIKDTTMSDLMTVPDSTIEVQRSVIEAEAVRSQTVSYLAHWTPLSDIDRRMTDKWKQYSLIAGLTVDNRANEVAKVAKIDVTVTLAGKSMRYQTLALFSAGNPMTLDFLDIVLGATNLATALAEQLPNEADAPDPNAAAGPNSVSASSVQCPDGQYTDGAFDDLQVDTQEHSNPIIGNTGSHQLEVKGHFLCQYFRNCTVKASADRSGVVNWTESGTSWNPSDNNETYHKIAVSSQQITQTSFVGGTAPKATFAGGGAVCTQEVTQCGITVSVTVGVAQSGISISVTGSHSPFTLWQYSDQFDYICNNHCDRANGANCQCHDGGQLCSGNSQCCSLDTCSNGECQTCDYSQGATCNSGFCVMGAILSLYNSYGGCGNATLGWPTTNESVTPDRVGRYNHFSGSGSLPASVYWSPSTGAHSVHGKIRQTWAASGWEKGPCGYPVSEEYKYTSGPLTGDTVEEFQNGYIYWDGHTATRCCSLLDPGCPYTP